MSKNCIFFLSGPKQCFYLAHSAREFFKILAFKKKKKKKWNFKRLYLKTLSNFSFEFNTFREFIQFSSKQCCFLHAVLRWVHAKGLHPLQSSVQLSSACRDERVNDEPVKVLNLLFFCILFRSEEKLAKNCIFSFLNQSNAFT